MSTNPVGSQSNSARKIANYTQSISSGVTNLLTELGRVSASTPVSGSETNDAILLQLQTITAQIAAMNTRLNEMNTRQGDMHNDVQDMKKQLDSTPSITGSDPIELPVLDYSYGRIPQPTAEEHNTLARLHNKGVWRGYDALIPLRNSRNNYIFGFPTTLGDLYNLDSIAEEHLRKAFGLASDDPRSFYEFCGVRIEAIRGVMEYYLPGEMLAMKRIKRRQKRDEEVVAAGPPTAKSKRAAENHNRVARAANGKLTWSTDALIQIHDERNIPVTGFPKNLGDLASPHYEADVLYFLKEYGQETYPKDDCRERWIKFVGVSIETAWENAESSLENPGTYWLM